MSSSTFLEEGDYPQALTNDLWVFPPNNQCNGSRSWWLGCSPEPVLIACPPVNAANIDRLKKFSLGCTALIVLTNRESHGRVSELQDLFVWPVWFKNKRLICFPDLPN